MENENIHKDHRARLKSRYKDLGLSGLSEVNAVELMLFYSIPYKDTNVTAHRLLEQFGSLNGILDADFDALTQVNGIGENSALMIKLFRDISQAYSSNLFKQRMDLSNENIENLIREKLNAEKVESYYLVFVDNLGKLRDIERVCDSEQNNEYCNRKFAQTVLRSKYKNVIIAHNHLSSFANPRPNDISSAASTIAFLRSISINVIDYIIFTETDRYSMKSNAKFRDMFL
ncbi:MAG: JAB domain-containing protein [Clostridia bacterium]|nr:JAB domain-containing protein [Clostridia bacterium]